jgi:hypothetical protein
MILTATDVTGIIPSEWVKYEAAVVAILNIVNRFFTSQPVSLLGDRGGSQQL